MPARYGVRTKTTDRRRTLSRVVAVAEANPCAGASRSHRDLPPRTVKILILRIVGDSVYTPQFSRDLFIDRLEIFERGGPDFARSAEMQQTRTLTGRANAGNLVQRAGRDRPAALGAVGADGIAVDFVAQGLEIEQQW